MARSPAPKPRRTAPVPVVELLKQVQLESTEEEYLDQRVRDNGGFTEKFTIPGRRGPPDRLITLPPGPFDHGIGRMELAEVKRPKGGHFSELQNRDHERRLKFGIKVAKLWTHQMIDDYITIKFGSNAK